MENQGNFRAEVIRRNQRRKLDDRDHKLMMAMFGILGYSSVMNLVVGVLTVVRGGNVVDAVSGIVLGILYGLAAHQVWFKSTPKWWLIVVPSAISMTLAVASILLGVFAIVPLLLNAGLLALIPIRIRAKKALDLMDDAHPRT
jgi:hypothetical protein